MSSDERKVHLLLSIESIAFLHALAESMGVSVGKANDYVLTLARKANVSIARREQVLPRVIADLEARVAKGAKEYGEPLTTNNGRKALVDAYEEQLDQVMYLAQHLMEQGL